MSSTDSSKSTYADNDRVEELIGAAWRGEKEQLGRLLQFYFNYLTVLASTQ